MRRDYKVKLYQHAEFNLTISAESEDKAKELALQAVEEYGVVRNITHREYSVISAEEL